MAEATFRFYEELSDFLPQDRRKRDFVHRFEGTPAVKDQIEALGVPHPEVDLILVNGEPVGFEQKMADGDRIAVYPVFESIDISAIGRLRPEPLREARFVLDVHLGKLARLLRLLGLDVCYPRDVDDPELAEISASQQRILLTRDRRLLMRSKVTRGYCPRSDDAVEQAREVVRRFDLEGAVRPFTRCLSCGGRLAPTDKDSLMEFLPEPVLRLNETFSICMACRQVYWPGSHHQQLRRRVREILAPDDTH